jgi:hypothetical protein
MYILTIKQVTKIKLIVLYVLERLMLGMHRSILTLLRISTDHAADRRRPPEGPDKEVAQGG